MRTLCVASLIAEGISLFLYGRAFGGGLVGLLSVRAALTAALVVFSLRGNGVARVVLAAVRLMAGLVGAIMATVVDVRWLAVAIGAVAAAELAIALVLFMKFSGQIAKEDRSSGA